MKKLLLIGIVLFCLFGCSTNHEDINTFKGQILKADTLIVGTSPDYPPFETMNASGQLEGFEIDVMEKLVAIINEQQGTQLKLEWKVMDFNNIIGALQANQIDIGMSAFTYRADRDCLFAKPHILSKQVIITRADTGITTKEDLAGKKVGAGIGTTGAKEVEKIDGAILVHPGDYTIMFQALQAGQLDAVVCDESVGDNYVLSMGFVKLEEVLADESMSAIINKNKPLIEEAVSQAVEEFLNSPDYQLLLQKWGLVTE